MIPLLALLTVVTVVASAAWVWRQRQRSIAVLEGLARDLGEVDPNFSSPDEGARTVSGLVATGRSAFGSRTLQVEVLERALHAVGQGTVIFDIDGTERYRNRLAESFVDARHGAALVASAISEMLDLALAGDPVDTDVELYGPPQRTVLVRARPIRATETDANPDASADVSPDARADSVGAIVGAVVFIEDITAVVAARRIRRDFVANVSHELKTPVGAISLLAETAADEPDRETASRLNQRIHHEAIRLGNLVDELLDLSRIEGHSTAAHSEVQVSELLAEAATRVEALARERNITVTVSLPERSGEDPDSGLCILGDRLELTAAVQSLLENAITYSDEHSVVEVRVAEHEGDLSIVVQDNGIGIPQHDQDRIFERFYRVDRGRGRATGGTGLGLSIVRNVATNHGGSVGVVSREGEGATFTMSLPKQTPAKQDPS